MMVRALDLQPTGRGVWLPAAALLSSDPGQVVHVPNASEITTVWRYRNLSNLILIPVTHLTVKVRYGIQGFNLPLDTV